MKQNPWLGLASYDEQAVAQGYKFCGRERAINELYSIVDNNLLTTLYGKSGIGKSSLLQAGVFPRLRTDNYLPVMIRLGAGIAGNYSYTTIVMDAVRKAVAEAGGRCVATQEGEAACEEERLWHFFHSTEFQSAGGDTLFPVIVLDQFEELYYRDKQQLSTLLKALYLLVDDSPLSGSDDDEVPNYRVVLSIREDDLFHLEDSIDKLRLTEMKYNRYRLRELTDDEARDVVLLPGAHLFSPSEADAIADRIIQEAKAGSEEISTAVLSLLCSRIYYACPTLTDSSASTGITLQRITEFFKQAEGNFLKSFYDDIIKELKSPAKWYYIEDALVTDEGRRNSVLKSEFDKMVPNSDFLFRGEKSMLRCITTAGTDEPRVEIIHDMLARQMMSSRNERKLQEQATALRKQRITAIAIILLAIVLGAVFYTQYRSIVAERNSMLKMQSHYIAEKAKKLIEEGKPFLATRLLLAVLPEDLNKPNRPYITEVEFVLRNADNILPNVTQVARHDFQANSVQFSPDEEYIITTSWDKTAKIWEAKTGKQVGETMEHEDNVNFAKFSPDGELIVTASDDHTAKIWDTKTGKQVGETMEHEDNVSFAQFSPNSKLIVTASDDHTAKIWDAKTGKQVEKTMEHEDNVSFAQFSPDSKLIVTASDDLVTIWDIQTGEQVGENIKHDSFIRSVQFSPNGNHFVTTSWDETAKIRETKTGEQMGKTMTHYSPIKSAQFSPDGKLIVTASDDHTAKIWDALTGEQVGKHMIHEDDVNTAQFSPDGKYIVTSSRDYTSTWNVQTGEQVGEPMKHDSFVRSVQFSPNGNYIVMTSWYYLKIWNVQTEDQVEESMRYESYTNDALVSTNGNYYLKISDGSPAKIWYEPAGAMIPDIETEGGDSEDYYIQFSPNGEYIVTVSEDYVTIWDVQTGEQIGEAIERDSAINFAQFSPDGKYIITESNDDNIGWWDYNNIVKIWNVQTGEQVGEAIEHNSDISSTQFSPDGKYIVTASDDNITIWNIQTGEQVGENMKHDSDVYSAQFSPDGKYIVTVSNDYITIWNVQTGEQVGENMKHDSDINSAQFSPDGKYIVTISDEDLRPSNNIVKIWDIQTGEQIGKTIKHDSRVRFTQFSLNGKYIATTSDGAIFSSGNFSSVYFLSDNPRDFSSEKNIVKIWDIQTGEQVGKTIKPDSDVNSTQLSPDGKYIVTLSDDYIAKIWNVHTGEQVGEPIEHDYDISSAQFSPDGKYIITISEHTVKIWYVQKGKQVGEITGEDFEVYSAQFSPDGKYIITASWGNTTKRTKFSSLQELIDKYRELFRDWPLTEEELIEYNFK